MSISYKVVSKKPGGMAGHQPPRYYPVLTNRRTNDTRDLIALISRSSTMSGADVVGIIQSLVELIPELLMSGKNVRLDGFGTFSVHARSKGQPTPEKVTLRDIESLHISFLPDKQIKHQLKRAEFKKVK